jgi:glutathione S-transferase
MPNYKLTYFNGRGRAEIIRLVLTAAGIPFEDVRVPFEDWPKLKQTMPFAQMPVFEIDGKVQLCQSLAVARYLARLYNLAGKTELEQAQADMIIDCVEDMLRPIPMFFRIEQDPVKKAELKKKYIEEQMPDFLTKLEALANKLSPGKDHYLVGDSVTWADLYLVRAEGALKLQAGVENPFDKEKYPKLTDILERVHRLPKISAYTAKLPATGF